LKENTIFDLKVILHNMMTCNLRIYEDRFVIEYDIGGVFGNSSKGIFGGSAMPGQTIYFTDLASVQLKKSDSTPGFLLFSGKGQDFRLQFNEEYNTVAEKASIFMNEKASFPKNDFVGTQGTPSQLRCDSCRAALSLNDREGDFIQCRYCRVKTRI